MSVRLKLMLVAFAIFLIAIAVIEGTRPTPINWSETFRFDQSHPFATKIFYEELNQTFFPKTTISRIDEPLYEYFEKRKKHKNTLFLFVGDYFDVQGPAFQKLYQFVKDGNTAFIAARFHSNDISEILKVQTTNFYPSDCGLSFEATKEKTKISVYSYGEVIKYPRVEQNYVFNNLPKEAEILGNYHIEDVEIPNFARVRVGEGEFLFHTEPKIFTNYFMLKSGSFRNAYHAIKYVPQPITILWYDGLKNLNYEGTPLRVILQNPALRWSWYIILLSLFILLIFRTRREQRPIPIIEKPKNRSVEFAQTIASLYYERGTPLNLIQKKIEHFLFRLRKNAHVTTDDLTDAQFIKYLSIRSGIKEDELLKEFKQIERLKKLQNADEQMLKSVNHTLNQLMHKLQI